jgi:hypothetical protein
MFMIIVKPRFISVQAHIWEMNKRAEELVRHATLEHTTKCIVLIRNYNFSYSNGEYVDCSEFYDMDMMGEYGRLFYYEDNKLITTRIIGNRSDLYRYLKATDAYDLTSSEKLGLKKLALNFINSQDLLNNADHMMSLFAAKPNNPKILRYLIRLGRDKNLPIEPLVLNALRQAVRHSCLSNVMGILAEYNDIASNFFLGDLFGPDQFFNGKQLKTDTPIIDIMMLFYQRKNNFIYSELTSLFEIIDNDQEEKIAMKSYKKRQAIALTMIISLRYHGQLDMSWDHFLDLVNLLNDEKLTFQFYKEGTLVSTFHQGSSKANFSSMRYLALSEKIFSDKNMLQFIPLLIHEIQKLVQIHFPSEIALLIKDYMMPSIFNLVSKGLKKMCTVAPIEDKASFPVYRIPVAQQSPGSSDCGYWTFFNTCSVFSRIPNLDSDSKSNSHSQFQTLKEITKKYLEKKSEDLTALDLEILLKEASKKEETELNSLFPHLRENLLRSQEALGIPAYTIINSFALNENQKFDISYIFGGCLPHLKMRLAINFYVLSKNKESGLPLFHLILVGVNQHWHLQFLAFSDSKPAPIKSFLFDSGTTPPQILQSVKAHLQDLLDNAEKYVKNVAKEMIPDIDSEVRTFSKLLRSTTFISESQENTFYDHCQLLIQFFSVLGNLPMVKEFLPTLELARKAACLLQKDNPRFKNVSDKFSRLRRLQAEKFAGTGLFPISAPSATSQKSGSTPFFKVTI